MNINIPDIKIPIIKNGTTNIVHQYQKNLEIRKLFYLEF